MPVSSAPAPGTVRLVPSALCVLARLSALLVGYGVASPNARFRLAPPFTLANMAPSSTRVSVTAVSREVRLRAFRRGTHLYRMVPRLHMRAAMRALAIGHGCRHNRGIRVSIPAPVRRPCYDHRYRPLDGRPGICVPRFEHCAMRHFYALKEDSATWLFCFATRRERDRWVNKHLLSSWRIGVREVHPDALRASQRAACVVDCQGVRWSLRYPA